MLDRTRGRYIKISKINIIAALDPAML